MTRVCLLGAPDVVLRYELLSRETARNALATYDLEEPYENALVLETVSVGAAVSLLNDLNWYLTRFVDAALVNEPSISESEWLSRELAEAVRNDRIAPDETGTYLKIYGVVYGDDDTTETTDSETDTVGRPVEPLYVRRTDGERPKYDLRDVEETFVVRVTESEFGQ